MGTLLGRLRLVQTLMRSGRLALRLLRDRRTPLTAKLILAAAALYVISPIDILPDLIPILGQMDDVAIVGLALELFFKQVPPWLRAEHEAALGQTTEGARVVDHDDVTRGRGRATF